MGRRSVSRVASRSHLVSMLAARPNANFSCFASFSSVPQTITTGDLYLLFETYGRITSIHFLESQVIHDRKASHIFVCLAFDSAFDAVAALQMNGKRICGPGSVLPPQDEKKLSAGWFYKKDGPLSIAVWLVLKPKVDANGRNVKETRVSPPSAMPSRSDPVPPPSSGLSSSGRRPPSPQPERRQLPPPASHRSPSPPPGRKLDLIVYKDHNCRFDEMEDLDVDAERTVAVSG
jgi:hypothetical protein